jgi:hypothetical protein
MGPWALPSRHARRGGAAGRATHARLAGPGAPSGRRPRRHSHRKHRTCTAAEPVNIDTSGTGNQFTPLPLAARMSRVL